MKKARRVTYTIFYLIVILSLCAGCASKYQTTVPYGSDEYENGEWTVDELVKHFEELGFYNIVVEEYANSDEDGPKIKVRVEDERIPVTERRILKKDETLGIARKIYILTPAQITILTKDNCPELVEIAQVSDVSEESNEKLDSFMKEHNGEYIEFDGTITDWYDELWYASGISFTVSFEDYEGLSFSWSGISSNELGFENDYSTGCVSEGIPAHVMIKIIYSEEGCMYEIESIELGN